MVSYDFPKGFFAYKINKVFLLVVHSGCHHFESHTIVVKVIKFDFICFLNLQERKLDEKLPLLFSRDKKFKENEVKVSASGALNGAASSKIKEAMSSSAIAVASPTGMIMEQKAEAGPTDQNFDPESEGLTVTVCSSSDNEFPAASTSGTDQISEVGL